MGKSKLDIFTEQYLRDFNPEQPFVWRLRLPYSRFVELEKLVEDSSDQLSLHPIAAIVFLAEWYKWRKRGSGKHNRKYNPSSSELRQLLIDADIDIDRHVAVNPETGRHSWLYSIYVLGGLPILQELERKNTSKLLRNICLMFHGAKVDFSSNIADADRAEAFRKSLESGGSLRAYIKEIIEGGSPFSPEDTCKSDSECFRLITRILKANEEARKDKFDLRWNIICPIGSSYISRRLLLWLLPEISGIGLSQYLMYDRVGMWNIPNPRECKWLDIGLRYYNGKKCIAEKKDIATYTNTGIAERGFVCWGVENAIMVNDVPVDPFDSVEIFVIDDKGNEGVTQTEEVPSAMQLYRTDNYMEWSSRTAPQRETAVLWTRPWQPTEPISEGLNTSRHLRSREYGEGTQRYNFTLIPDVLRLEEPDGEIRTFYNRQGYDDLIAILHGDIFAYEDGNKVLLKEYDSEEEIEEETLLPVIFNDDDLTIVHRGDDDESTELEEMPIFQWKKGNRYIDWTKENRPPTGRIKVRCEVKGRHLISEFLYLGGQIKRDIENKTIIYPGGQLKDNADEKSDKPLTPTLQINIPFDSGYAVANIWRPLNYKEVNIGDRCWERIAQDRLSVPATSCDRVWAGIFNKYGYRKYQCYPLMAYYSTLNKTERWSRLADGQPTKATEIDPLAPDCLDVVMARKNSTEADKSNWLLWDYNPDNEPSKFDYSTELPKMTVLFQDRESEVNPVNIFCPKRGDLLPFKARSILKPQNRLACFEYAAKYNAYFSAFYPLNEITKEQFTTDIIEQLLVRYNGIIPKEIQNELYRAELELGIIIFNQENNEI